MKPTMLDDFYTSAFPVLQIDEQYYLREQQIEDVHAFFEYYSNPIVGKHILANKPRNLTEASAEIHYCRSLFPYKKGIHWAIARKSDNVMIGSVGIYLNNFHLRGEIYYELAPEYWNQGIMSKALTITKDFCFQTVGLMRLEAIIVRENIASVIVLKKVGFDHEGTLKQYRYFDNKFHDIEMYAIIAKQKTAAPTKVTIQTS